MSPEFLWYIPNTVEPGHRGDDTTSGWGSIEYSTDLARTAERHGWGGALLGTGWGRPDTFTVATALAARTTTFKPLIAIRPGYWHPANFAGAAATLDQLSRGRVLVNIVSGLDNPAAYGDTTVEPPERYARTQEFLYLLRRLWTEEDVTFHGEHFRVTGSTVAPRPYATDGRPHPTLYFGGASEAAERVSAAEADVQLTWTGNRRKAVGSSGSSTSPSAERCSTPASTPPPARSAAGERRPPGWSARPTTSPRR